MAYSYDDFVSAANAAGMMGNFNQQDLETARRNPEFGLSMLSLMQDSANATTDEQRVLTNEAANQLRQTYGSYVIGEDGAPQYSGSYGQQIQDILGQIGSYGDYQYGNEQKYQQLMDAIINRQPFSYDPESDPSWGAYRKAYLREGDRATAQALAQASAASGGRPSSHAVTAATQAGNYYAGQLADKLPALEQMAYDRYLSDFNMKLNELGVLSGDREADYGAWLDQLGLLQQQLGNLQTMDNTDYSRFLDALKMAYQREQDELAKQQSAAELMAAKGDYTLMGQLLGLTQEQIDVLNGVKKKDKQPRDPTKYGQTGLTAADVAGWTALDWNNFFANISGISGMTSAQAEFDAFNNAGLIPNNAVSAAKDGVTGYGMGWG